MSAVALAACASHDERAQPRRHVSIKDDPADVAPYPRAQKTSHVVNAPAPRVQEPTRFVPKTAAVAAAKPVPAEPAPVLPKAELPPKSSSGASAEPVVAMATVTPPAKLAVDPQPATKSAALDTRPVAPPKPVDALPVEPPKTTVVTPEPAVPAPRPAVVIKPVETPVTPDTRPTADARRKAAPETVPPPRNTAVPASPVAVAVQAPAKPEPKAETRVEPKIAALSDDQRVASILASVDGYMKGGRFQNARSLLEDAAKSGHPKLLTALAESYDPLVLREQYPKLARAGEPEKAISLYEQATANGATDLGRRITALKVLAGPRR